MESAGEVCYKEVIKKIERTLSLDCIIYLKNKY